MLFSGADLIRTSGQQAERLDRIKAAESVAPVANPGQSQTALDGETQGALLRFARFIQKEGQPAKKKTPPPKKVNRGVPAAYALQIRLTQDTQGPGAMMDLYA